MYAELTAFGRTVTVYYGPTPDVDGTPDDETVIDSGPQLTVIDGGSPDHEALGFKAPGTDWDTHDE